LCIFPLPSFTVFVGTFSNRQADIFYACADQPQEPKHLNISSASMQHISASLVFQAMHLLDPKEAAVSDEACSAQHSHGKGTHFDLSFSARQENC